MRYLPIIYLFFRQIFRLLSPVAILSANPKIYLSAVLQTRKSDILDPLLEEVGELIATYVPLESGSSWHKVLEAHAKLGGNWPVVVKPEVGERGLGVFIARDEGDLRDGAARQVGDFLLQDYVRGGEFGIFYIRHPATGVVELTVAHKLAPQIMGDGERTLGKLISASYPGTSRYLHRKYSHHLDSVPEQNEVIELEEILHGFRGMQSVVVEHDISDTPIAAGLDKISGKLDFYYGRLDFKADDLDALLAGRGKILEINGVASLPPEIAVRGATMREQWRTIYHYFGKAYEIGNYNRAHGAPRYTLIEARWATAKHFTYKARFHLVKP